jgi:hypothetical protein
MKQPISLIVVAALFILIGAGAVWDIASDLVRGRVDLDLTAISLFIGIGLLRRQERWRRCALLVITMGFALVVLFTGVGLSVVGRLTAFGHEFAAADRSWDVLGVALVTTSVLGWMHWVLTLRSIRQLFASRTDSSAEQIDPATLGSIRELFASRTDSGAEQIDPADPPAAGR